ncbi:SRR1-like protein [Smittium culicis]|uniref:SRR1-like protein n=1 Tax=Smittium culicis TaxID=133412 RepID=A0A1R1YPA6_9FUNG|nr:SRR1-like protein [Smittium culicis]
MSTVAKISRKQRRLQNKLQAQDQALPSTSNNNTFDTPSYNSSDTQDDDAPDSWTKVSNSPSSTTVNDLPFNVLLNKVSKLKRLLLLSKFYSKLCDKIFPKIREFNPDEIVCYGIGSFSALSAAQIQLALLLVIKDELLQNCPSNPPSTTATISNSTNNSNTCLRVLAYDPVFSDSDTKLLNHFGILIIPTNEAAKRYALSNTLFYMPHCEAFLYDNLLSANSTTHHPTSTSTSIPSLPSDCSKPNPRTSASAEPKLSNLSRLMIIGNDLSNLPRASKKLTYISKFSSSVISIQFPDEETHLDSSINRFHPFNDTALMTFDSL